MIFEGKNKQQIDSLREYIESLGGSLIKECSGGSIYYSLGHIEKIRLSDHFGLKFGAFQIDIILKSLELYAYTFNFVCTQKKSETLEENLRKCLIRDTYHQITSEYVESKKQNPINEKTNNVLDIEKRFRQIA